ncbi:MAG: hypothetical protein CL917_19040 [Deltaproteobacteria bacterium]|nr:hypothetical protein [Deltaproteobacteria bacterium]
MKGQVVTAKEKFDQVCAEVCERLNWTRTTNSIEVPLGKTRSQTVELDFFVHEAQEMVRLHTSIGSTRRIRPERLSFALELNFNLPHGSLAVKNDTLVLVDTLVLGEVDAIEFESSANFLAKTGDQYELTLFGVDEN